MMDNTPKSFPELPTEKSNTGHLLVTDDLPDEPLEIVFAEDVKSRTLPKADQQPSAALATAESSEDGLPKNQD